jgi:multidrug resistance efflux pump
VAAIPAHRGWRRSTGFLLLAVLVWWIAYRLGHSITDDAFIESDMIELAPRVEGQSAEMLVADSESIVRGQPLARIDPVPYQRKVGQARAALKVAEAEHATAVAALERLEAQVPQKIAAAEHQLAVAENESKSAAHDLARRRSPPWTPRRGHSVREPVRVPAVTHSDRNRFPGASA